MGQKKEHSKPYQRTPEEARRHPNVARQRVGHEFQHH